MPEKPLLLASAKSGVLVGQRPPTYEWWVRRAALGVGILCVLVGAADLSSRMARAALGDDAAFFAFGPAAALAPGSAATSTPGVITPSRLRIAALGVDALVERVGKKADGSMAAPREYKNVGWYEPGKKPGEEGNAVFAGHVNNSLTMGGVFSNLSKIKKGEYVTVSDEAGRTQVYKVSDIREYAWDSAPEASVFSTSGPSQVVLITCEGEWLPSERTFDKRLVVIAKPAY